MADPLFPTAPKEVVDYFDRRGTKTSWRWTDFAPHEHALGFTVARTAGFDVIEDLRAAVRKAAVERIPFEQFQNELTPILQQKGWWGKKVIKDPAGFKEKVQLGSLRRLKTIYWANIRSSHAAGEWARTQANKEFLPYLRYKISLAAERRKEHMSWVGTTLPVDHPWWRTHYPPNGWHCQCRVEQIGETAAGKTPADKRKAPPLRMKLWKDTRSGKVWRVPDGIDPGWQGNPGYVRQSRIAEALTEAISASAAALAPAGRDIVKRSVVASGIKTPEFRHLVSTGLGYDRKRATEPAIRAMGDFHLPVAVTPKAIVDAFVGITLPDTINLQARDAAHILEGAVRDTAHRLSIEDWAGIQAMVDTARPDDVHRISANSADILVAYKGDWWILAIQFRPGRNLLRLKTIFRAPDKLVEKFRAGTRRRDQE